MPPALLLGACKLGRFPAKVKKMAKVASPKAPSLAAAKKAAKAPSAVRVTAPAQDAPAAAPAGNPFGALVTQVQAVADAPQPLRGAQAVLATASVTLGPKLYRVAAAHNAAAWAAILPLVQSGPAPVAAVCKALQSTPAAGQCGSAIGMVAYLVRRQHLVLAK